MTRKKESPEPIEIHEYDGFTLEIYNDGEGPEGRGQHKVRKFRECLTKILEIVADDAISNNALPPSYMNTAASFAREMSVKCEFLGENSDESVLRKLYYPRVKALMNALVNKQKDPS